MLTNHQINDISVFSTQIKEEERRKEMEKEKSKCTKKKQGSRIDPKFLKLKKWIMALLSLVTFILPVLVSFADEELLWQSSDNGIVESIVTALHVIRSNPNIVYAGGGRSIYKSIDAGKNWTRVLTLKGERKGINFISSCPNDFSKIFVATSDGLYVSQDEGGTWHRAFKGMDDLQRDVSCISISPDSEMMLIGTKRGLFTSHDKAKNWNTEDAFINKQINSIAIGEDYLYVCVDDGLYYTQRDYISWDRIYVVRARNERGSEQYSDNNDNEEECCELNYMIIDDKRVYLATDYGLYYAMLGKRNWQAITSEGLLTRQVEFILETSKRIFSVTRKGIFEYNAKSSIWRDYSSGLTTLRINMIDASSVQGVIYAATDRGLFKAALDKVPIGISLGDRQGNRAINNKEPGILEVQQAAIDYAEVSPDKIKWMRKSAKNKALLPKVSLSLDRDIDRTIDLDRGGTNDPDFYIEGPRDRSFDWGVDLSWDLGELIWNDDQANIDVRSRLMVQLRNDVLDEVTKLYFARKRLQAELMQNSAEDSSKRALKQLRLDELTANIDGLTGGYLSSYAKD